MVSEACRAYNIKALDISRLLKLPTMCESPLHGPRDYADRVWGRSASCMLLNIWVFLDFKNLTGFCVGKGIVNMDIQEASCEYDSKEKKLKAKKAATEQRYCSAVLIY